MHVNRRDFLRKSVCAALGGASLYSALGNLRMVAAATSPNVVSFPDYKALVCVYLYGGNDSFNTIVPYDATHYNAYAASRNQLALPKSDIQTNSLLSLAASGGLPGGAPSDSASYGLHPAMGDMSGLGVPNNTGLRALFNSGKVAIVGNVGTLLYPLKQAQYQNSNDASLLPPQLFSHDDQTNYWQTSRPDNNNANGWGGSVADLLYTANSNTQLSMSISLSGTNRYQRGATISQYSIDPYGVATMAYLDLYQQNEGVNAYNALLANGTQVNMLERAFASGTNRAIANYGIINTALNAAPVLTTQFPSTDLGAQLAMVAKLISVRAALGMKRQVFFVSADNYDTHGAQAATQLGNLTDLSQSLTAFYNATAELSVQNNVTAFTASDFGRSLPVNSDGSDHGWGGHHFVVGGAVRGQRFYGTMPSLAASGNTDDTGQGQIIPTTAVDQYAATLASWFGVDAGGIATIFPNLGRFSSSNLRFLG